MTDPIDIRDKCLSILPNQLDTGKPYHFKWLGYDLYLFLNEEGKEEEDVINIYVTED